jgi:hypothetical protein
MDCAGERRRDFWPGSNIARKTLALGLPADFCNNRALAATAMVKTGQEYKEWA